MEPSGFSACSSVETLMLCVATHNARYAQRLDMCEVAAASAQIANRAIFTLHISEGFKPLQNMFFFSR
jgi:hypothetical protein